MKVNTTLRIDDNAIKYYKDNYRSNHAGCVLAVEGYPFLRDETKKLLAGKFSEEELLFIEKSSNGTKITPKELASRRHWEAEIGDYYESKDASVDFEWLRSLIEKIRELSPIERFVLREMIILSK